MDIEISLTLLHIENMPRAFIILAVLISALLTTKDLTQAQEGTWAKIPLSIENPSSVEITPWSIFVGANQGLYESKDLGRTWVFKGLSGRKVTDIERIGDNILAATYYWINNEVGSFMSQDKGNTWRQIGPKFSVSQVEADNGTWYIGGYSHGLWISSDQGQSWTQRIGNGWYGPEIKSIASSEKITIAATPTSVFKTTNSGESFEQITFLQNKGITFIDIQGSVVLASSNSATGGLYLSTDLGISWVQLTGFGMGKTGAVRYFKNNIYVCSETFTGYTVFKSTDLGKTWSNTNLDLPNSYLWCNSMALVNTTPDVLIASLSPLGLYRYEIPQVINQDPVFRIPWNYKNNLELTDKITSYFDHKYPLYAYPYKSEPDASKYTTTNYLGISAPEPDLFYSSHNGIDFALQIGTQVLSPADGIAYFYACSSCGNTIKIVHQGYSTYYMHLQGSGLVNLSTTKGVEVRSGQVIGKVGMTGNTTGPHLHFSVQKDADGNGNPDNDYPEGRTDPFGWQNSNFIDPWGLFEWSDSMGTHNGVFSQYMWNFLPKNEHAYINDTPQSFTRENIKIDVDDEAFEEGATVTLTPYSNPEKSLNTQTHKYIENTSFLINAVNHFGEEISELKVPISITISLIQSDLGNVIQDSIKLYFWDTINHSWIPVSSAYDQETQTVNASLNHFSQFAVLGTPVNTGSPETVGKFFGVQDQDGIFINYPLITFEPSVPGYTYFSINTNEWLEYIEPFYIDSNGEFVIKYKTVSENNTSEMEKISTIKVSVQDNSVNRRRVTGASFNTNGQ